MKTPIDKALFQNLASAHGSLCLILKQLSEAAHALNHAAQALSQIENYGSYMSQSLSQAFDMLELKDHDHPTQE